MTAGVGQESREEPFWTGPNVLSMARVPLGLTFAWCLHVAGGVVGAAVVLLLAGVTDALDGMWARRQRGKNSSEPRRAGQPGRGSWLDPICDKIFVAIVLASLFERHAPLGWLALIAARELVQLPLSLVYRAVPFLRHWLHYDFTASVLGKLATVTQFVAIGFLLVWPGLARGPVYAAAALGLTAVGDYLLRAWRLGAARVTQAKAAGAAGATASGPAPSPSLGRQGLPLREGPPSSSRPTSPGGTRPT
jgi:cardiolipin synthase